MDLATIRENARQKLGPACKVCPVCNGVACAGQVPGMGGVGTGRSFHNNMEALAACRLHMRTVHDVVEPVKKCTILGMDLALPVIGAAIGGISFNMNNVMSEIDYCRTIIEGCKAAGVIAMTGDGPLAAVFDSGITAIQESGGYGIPIIKPREPEVVIEMANRAADAGAPAFGMDIDAAYLVNMKRAGQPVFPKTVDQLAKIKRETRIPFIVKGIMSPIDAELCCQAGVDAIVVSNHGGRALDDLPGSAEVLPEIADTVDGRLTILADGGIRSGGDILKMLALGANAVLLGRPLAIAAAGGGAEGVTFMLNKFAGELEAAMILTGTADVADVDPDVIW
ncbi:MAG: alpha-hydroxy-acid oxidizing protein [Selenomonadales bacterium]|nr:alpha-hydroxy-acid oxidizing protein [Selenomonadales bacterium]